MGILATFIACIIGCNESAVEQHIEFSTLWVEESFLEAVKKTRSPSAACHKVHGIRSISPSIINKWHQHRFKANSIGLQKAFQDQSEPTRFRIWIDFSTGFLQAIDYDSIDARGRLLPHSPWPDSFKSISAYKSKIILTLNSRRLVFRKIPSHIDHPSSLSKFVARLFLVGKYNDSLGNTVTINDSLVTINKVSYPYHLVLYPPGSGCLDFDAIRIQDISHPPKHFAYKVDAEGLTLSEFNLEHKSTGATLYTLRQIWP